MPAIRSKYKSKSSPLKKTTHPIIVKFISEDEGMQIVGQIAHWNSTLSWGADKTSFRNSASFEKFCIKGGFDPSKYVIEYYSNGSMASKGQSTYRCFTWKK